MSLSIHRLWLLRCFFKAIRSLGETKHGCIGELTKSDVSEFIGSGTVRPSEIVLHVSVYDGLAVASPLHQLYYY